ncbi:hypothetical protein [Bdellovibrio sp. HCB274]|uniref:hypothetical protein n=1 Tax=Bdellovibrio sp. HCB274 TaxID=3394361 RepID=UPI0039B4D1B0
MVNPLLKSVMIFGLVTALVACEATEETPSTGTSFTFAGLAKTWNSGCITATDGIVTNANRTSIELRLYADGTFTQNQYWFTGGSCINYAIVYSSEGSFTIGSESAGVYPLAFTVTASRMMAWNETVQSYVNSGCGGTTPYQSTPSATDNGKWKSTYMMSCFAMPLPNSGNKFVDNIGSLSGGILSLGQSQNGVPGVFQGGSVPTSTTLSFY